MRLELTQQAGLEVMLVMDQLTDHAKASIRRDLEKPEPVARKRNRTLHYQRMCSWLRTRKIDPRVDVPLRGDQHGILA